MSGEAKNIITNFEFTAKNFALIFDADEFFSVLWVTFFYTVFGTIGALLFGLFAALLFTLFSGSAPVNCFPLFDWLCQCPLIADGRHAKGDQFFGAVPGRLLW